MGTVSFLDGDYSNINSNIELDNKFYSINLEKISNKLRRKHYAYELNKHKIRPTRNEDFFIYMTGHGYT